MSAGWERLVLSMEVDAVVAAVDELVVDDEVAPLVPHAVGVDLDEHRVPVEVPRSSP